MVEEFVPYLDAKPGDWVVFSPEHGLETKGFWDKEMVMQVLKNVGTSTGTYDIIVTKDLVKRYPHLYPYLNCKGSNIKRGFRKALDHEIPDNINNTYLIY